MKNYGAISWHKLSYECIPLMCNSVKLDAIKMQKNPREGPSAHHNSLPKAAFKVFKH